VVPSLADRDELDRISWLSLTLINPAGHQDIDHMADSVNVSKYNQQIYL